MWFTLNWPLTNWAEQHCLKPKINISKQATPAQLILCFKPLVRPDLSTTNGSQLSSSNFIANCKERHKTPLYPHHSFASPTSTQKDVFIKVWEVDEEGEKEEVQYCTMRLPEMELLCKERFFHARAVSCERLGRTASREQSWESRAQESLVCLEETVMWGSGQRLSPTSQNRKERLEVSRNRAVFHERKGEGIIWQ